MRLCERLTFNEIDASTTGCGLDAGDNGRDGDFGFGDLKIDARLLK